MKVAIVCDWLVGIGGAERVILELHKLYPDAPIYTSQYDPKSIDWFKDADVRTLWLQRLPKGLRKFLPPLRAWAFSHLDLSYYEVVISAGGAESKAVKTGPGTLHIGYINSPTHYYWSRYEQYLKNPGFGWLDPLARLGLKILVGPLRRWDYKAAQRPDCLIAISSHIKNMIKEYYHRDSDVILPPVEVERFAGKSDEHRRGFVTAGRQTPYKRFDLAVLACTQLNLPLLVLGSGPDNNKLRKMAGKNVTFLSGKSDEEFVHYFKTSLAFIFPGLDDFGIVAVEALAAGTPVIAYGAGGAKDYVNPGRNGLLFGEQTVESLVKALGTFSSSKFDHQNIQNSAQKFSSKNFRSNFEQFVDSHLKK